MTSAIAGQCNRCLSDDESATPREEFGGVLNVCTTCFEKMTNKRKLNLAWARAWRVTGGSLGPFNGGVWLDSVPGIGAKAVRALIDLEELRALVYPHRPMASEHEQHGTDILEATVYRQNRNEEQGLNADPDTSLWRRYGHKEFKAYRNMFASICSQLSLKSEGLRAVSIADADTVDMYFQAATTNINATPILALLH